jgi:hypothetical protein
MFLLALRASRRVATDGRKRGVRERMFLCNAAMLEASLRDMEGDRNAGVAKNAYALPSGTTPFFLNAAGGNRGIPDLYGKYDQSTSF